MVLLRELSWYFFCQSSDMHISETETLSGWQRGQLRLLLTLMVEQWPFQVLGNRTAVVIIWPIEHIAWELFDHGEKQRDGKRSRQVSAGNSSLELLDQFIDNYLLFFLLFPPLPLSLFLPPSLSSFFPPSPTFHSSPDISSFPYLVLSPVLFLLTYKV